MKNILVTGAAGFIGRNIAKYLYENNFNVYGTFRNAKPEFDNIEYINCDLSTSILPYDNIDVVIHSAATIGANDIDILVENNMVATKNIVNFCEDKKVKQLIYLSTCSVYGETDTPINEESPRINQDYYGITKFIGEKYVEHSMIDSKLILRLPRVIGGRCDLDYKWIPQLANKLMLNETIFFFNPERRYNNFIHINDISKFIYESIDKKNNGIFGLASIEDLKVMEVIETLKRELKSSSELIEKKNLNKMEHPFFIDTSKAQNIGFTSMKPKEALIKFCKELKEVNNG